MRSSGYIKSWVPLEARRLNIFGKHNTYSSCVFNHFIKTIHIQTTHISEQQLNSRNKKKAWQKNKIKKKVPTKHSFPFLQYNFYAFKLKHNKICLFTNLLVVCVVLVQNKTNKKKEIKNSSKWMYSMCHIHNSQLKSLLYSLLMYITQNAWGHLLVVIVMGAEKKPWWKKYPLLCWMKKSTENQANLCYTFE